MAKQLSLNFASWKFYTAVEYNLFCTPKLKNLFLNINN